MAAELEADLTAAAADGVSPRELLGDPAPFAAAWADARGVDRPRRTRALVLAAIALFVAVALTGSGLALFAKTTQTVRAPGPVTLALRRTPPPNAVSVTTTAWTSYAPLSLASSRDDSRTLGIILLLVGAGGAAALTLISLATRERAPHGPARAASR
jgi:hypothetical protein